MKHTILLSLLLLAMVLSGCADSVSFSEAETMRKVGFLHGLWHGVITAFAFIVSLFSDKTAIYAIYNTGGWYDFGFVLGSGVLFGGGSSVKN